MVFSVFVISDNNFVLPFFSAISVFVAEFFVARFSVAHFPVAVFSVAVFFSYTFSVAFVTFYRFPVPLLLYSLYSAVAMTCGRCGHDNG